MAEGKGKFIEDAARVIDGRIADLTEELIRDVERDPNAPHLASDRSAIAEAEYLAKMIRSLASAPYRNDPYKVALTRMMRRARGE